MHSKELSIIEGFKSNDRRIFEKIYSMQYGSVENYILKNSGSEADAKDIFQEAILAAWLNVKEEKFTPKNEDSLGGYIFQIAKFKWLDKVKSKAFKTTLRIEREDAIDDEPNSISEKEIQEERISYLTDLYNTLDQKCKELLDRFYYQKMSLELIGKELSYDASTLKTMKYRCMKKLRNSHQLNGTK